ncbi:hypothetical protein SDC9_71974 [bioreactor metagenome]|uniref:Uncharacterized protein n=1 Tax=bioreactor metagenome TaxID=1076179 RepID=A0A644YAG6_9ZZZZ
MNEVRCGKKADSHRIDMAAHEGGDAGTFTVELHLVEFHAVDLLDHGGGHVGQASGAGGAHGDGLAGSGGLDELPVRGIGRILGDDHHAHVGHHEEDRLELVVVDLGKAGDLVEVRVLRAEENAVAVGGLVCHEGSGDGSRGTGAVLQDDGLSKMLLGDGDDGPGHVVHGASGAPHDVPLDVLFRVGTEGSPSQNTYRKQRNSEFSHETFLPYFSFLSSPAGENYSRPLHLL